MINNPTEQQDKGSVASGDVSLQLTTMFKQGSAKLAAVFSIVLASSVGSEANSCIIEYEFVLSSSFAVKEVFNQNTIAINIFQSRRERLTICVISLGFFPKTRIQTLALLPDSTQILWKAYRCRYSPR